MCIYNKKACVCVCVCEEGGVVLINILVAQLGPSKQKFLVPPLNKFIVMHRSFSIYFLESS